MSASTLKYEITKSWDGDDAPRHSNVILEITNNLESCLGESQDLLQKGIVIKIDAPYFNDPPVPNGILPGSTRQLWDYEVVEVFFLGKHDHYLEVEFSPKGHYLLLQLEGHRNVVKESLPLEHFRTMIDETSGRWTGEAVIPYDYFPQQVDKINAYAIHKSDPERKYMSLFPVPKGQFLSPDFHRLEFFQPIDMTKMLPPPK